jgi:hypothetical protein
LYKFFENFDKETEGKHEDWNSRILPRW